MKKLLAILILLLFLLLAWYSWGWYKNSVVCCPEEVVTEVEYGPLIFDCVTGDVITNDLWPTKKREIIADRVQGKKLLLIGPYFSSESESDGINRAEKVKALFTEIPQEDIIVDSRPTGDCEATKTTMLHELKYEWVTRNDDIIEHLNTTRILFKYNSDQEIVNELSFDFSDELADFLKNSGDNILITGHTDSDGDENYNMSLGLKRAVQYKNKLINLNVNENKIAVQSKGETMPLKPNDTYENKQMNRRIQVQIIE